MAFDETLNDGRTAFPCMSRRHSSHESRSLHGTRVLKEDEIIWESAVKRTPKGGNKSQAGKRGDLSSGIRQDFVETDFGNRRRDGAKSIFEGPPQQVPADAPFAKDEDGKPVTLKRGESHLVASRRIIICEVGYDDSKESCKYTNNYEV
eukprot:scaffold3260_cov285-Chaetoceros_neogracile.AAC.6